MIVTFSPPRDRRQAAALTYLGPVRWLLRFLAGSPQANHEPEASAEPQHHLDCAAEPLDQIAVSPERGKDRSHERTDNPAATSASATSRGNQHFFIANRALSSLAKLPFIK